MKLPHDIATALPATALSKEGCDNSEPDVNQVTIVGFIELNYLRDRGIAQFTMYDDDPLNNIDPKDNQRLAGLIVAIKKGLLSRICG